MLNEMDKAYKEPIAIRIHFVGSRGSSGKMK
jgi:hypothetical protein